MAAHSSLAATPLATPELLIKYASDEAVDGALRRLFTTYAAVGDVANATALTSAKFSKIWREAQLINSKGLTTVDLDLAFVRIAQAQAAKPPAAASSAARSAAARAAQDKSKKRTINYSQFLETVYAISCKLSGEGRPGAEPNGRRGLLLRLHVGRRRRADRRDRGRPHRGAPPPPRTGVGVRAVC